MSIATALTALQADISAARTAITTKGGTVTSGGGSSQLATDIATIPTGSTDLILAIKSGTKSSITTADDSFFTPYVSLSYGLYNMAYALNSLTSVEMGVTSISGYNAMNNTFASSKVLTASFPNLTTVGRNSLDGMLRGILLAGTLSVPNLVTYGDSAFNNINANSRYTTLYCNPAVLSASDNKNNLARAFAAPGRFANLTLSATAENDVNLGNCTSLTSASVLNVLQHLSTSATGLTCTFGSLTISSSDENYAAISALVSSLTNWTIAGLTL